MATHTRYSEFKKWVQSRGRRSIKLWMPTETVGERAPGGRLSGARLSLGMSVNEKRFGFEQRNLLCC